VIPAGYMLKTAIPPPEWFSPESAGRVDEVCSLSNCVVTDFTDAFQTWRHNGWWLYDSPVVIDEVVREQAIETQGMSLFYYELYEQELADDGWRAFEPNGFPIDVVAPKVKTLIGFDVTTHFVLQGPECSPLSCTNMAGELKANRHCLFDTFETPEPPLRATLFRVARKVPIGSSPSIACELRRADRHASFPRLARGGHEA
jgi:hypothetical protein